MQVVRHEDTAIGLEPHLWLAPPGRESGAPLSGPDKPLGLVKAAVHVLVVEDDALIALDVEQMLLAMGDIAVTVAHRLDEALGKLDQRSYDLAILDVDLGAHSSLSIAERLRTEDRPFLFLTGYRSEGLRDFGISEDQLLEKPFTEQALMSRVARLLRRA